MQNLQEDNRLNHPLNRREHGDEENNDHLNQREYSSNLTRSQDSSSEYGTLSDEEELDEEEYDVEEPLNQTTDDSYSVNNLELQNIFKNNINNTNFNKDIIVNNKDKLNTKKDIQYFQNAVELLQKSFMEKLADNSKSYKEKFDYLYPHLDDMFFNQKIANKKEFSEYKINLDINETTDFEKEAEKLSNTTFELASHQKFIRNFLSMYTPYNGVLLYHGLGTGKTCSAIGVAEETRQYMEYSGINKKILIVASPNVQENFRLQLFDETKLELINRKWFINNCAGNNFLEYINTLSNIDTKKKVVQLVNSMINNSYTFLGYIEFANLISKVSNITIDVSDKSKKNIMIKNKLQKYFGDRLIIIDEIHNIRDNKDNSNKLVAKQLTYLVKMVENMRLVLLSATPMFNDYKEIIFLVNILNMNDRRSTIEFSDVFNKDGTFVKNSLGEEIGKELLYRKMNGYISYVKGDNPFIFPYRVLPELFDLENSSKNPAFVYPTKNIVNETISNSKIKHFDLYLNKLSDYQEKIYNYVLSKANIKKDVDAYKYTTILQGLLALNIVYPSNETESDLNYSEDEELTEHAELSKISLKSEDGEDAELNVSTNKLIGNGLNSVVKYEFDKKRLLKHNYEIKKENIFLKENIQKYSAKMYSIMNSIIGSTGPIIIYSKYIESGLVPMALVLESYGFTKYNNSSLFKKAPIEPLDLNTYKNTNSPNIKPAKYIMITGDKGFSPNISNEIKVCNNKNNINGDNVKVILVSGAASEGLDFKYVRQIHIIEPWYNIKKVEQIIGRGVRTYSHKDLPFNQRNVKIYMHASILSNPDVESIDMYMYRISEEKAKQIGIITRMMKEISIDCHLNSDLMKFSEKKLSKMNEYTLKLSNNEEVKYKIGDKSYSDLCDYMESCEYKCYPNTDFTKEEDMKTFSDKHLEIVNSRILKIITDLFKEKYFYTKLEIINHVNIKDMYSILSINNTLNDLIKNDIHIMYDRYHNPGKIVNIGDLYIFQPLYIENQNISLYERENIPSNKVEYINYNIPSKKKDEESNDVKEVTDTEKIEEDKSNSGKELFDSIYYNYQNIINGNVNFIKKHDKHLYNKLAYLIHKNIEFNIFTFISNNDLKYLITNIIYDNINNKDLHDLYLFIFNTTTLGDGFGDGDKDEFVKNLKDLFSKNIVYLPNSDKSALITPYKNKDHKYTIYIINKNNEMNGNEIKGKNVVLKLGKQADYDRYKDIVNNKYTANNLGEVVGFIEFNSSISKDYYSFKVKYVDKDSYTKGRVCDNFHTISDKYNKFMNVLINKATFDFWTKKKLGVYMCTITEVLLRNMNYNNYNNKTWFLSPMYNILN